ncbi:MAG: hypothetical protein V3V22_03680, partial [Methylococcales bacterium]
TDPLSLVKATASIDVSPILAQVVGVTAANINAVATAGAIGLNCEYIPLVICPTEVDGELQTGCDDNGCNGIPFNQRICLKGGTNAKKSGECQSTSIPNGNFGVLRFDGFSGANDIRDLLSGDQTACTTQAGWENGNMVGPITQGIKERFNRDKVDTEYFQETNNYPLYENGSITNPDGIKDFRRVPIPVAEDCSLPVIEITQGACLFITQEAEKHGGSNEIYGEITATCPKATDISTDFPPPGGPYKIVLFKSSGSKDS